MGLISRVSSRTYREIHTYRNYEHLETSNTVLKAKKRDFVIHISRIPFELTH